MDAEAGSEPAEPWQSIETDLREREEVRMGLEIEFVRHLAFRRIDGGAEFALIWTNDGGSLEEGNIYRSFEGKPLWLKEPVAVALEDMTPDSDLSGLILARRAHIAALVADEQRGGETPGATEIPSHEGLADLVRPRSDAAPSGARMVRSVAIAGLVAGLIAGGLASLFATLLAHSMPDGVGMAIGYLSMLLALSAIVVAVKHERDTTGAIGFWRAFGIGLAITLIASILYALCWEIALTMMGGPDGFIDGYKAGLARHGASAQALAEVEGMRAGYRNPLIRLPLTMTEIAPVGVLVSLVTAALLRNPRILPARRVSA